MDTLLRCKLIVMTGICIVITSLSVYASEDLPLRCMTDCVTEYGSVLGISDDVEAHSNCSDRCLVLEPNYTGVDFTGIKWQCVEYVRRWLIINKKVTFKSVARAYQIWDKVDSVTDIETNANFPLRNFTNGSVDMPQVGDLLIYAQEFHGTGHVAVITKIDNDRHLIGVAEQNYENRRWHGNTARQIKYLLHENEIHLIDDYLIGWKRITPEGDRQ